MEKKKKKTGGGGVVAMCTFVTYTDAEPNCLGSNLITPKNSLLT